MEVVLEKVVKSIQDTKELAETLTSSFKKGDIIILTGNLGAGKTFLVKKFAECFNINSTSSPSFSIVNEYCNSEVNIKHFDFYRIKDIEELYNIGIEEYLSDNESIKFIEWGNLFKEVLPKNYYEISIFVENDKRNFVIKKYD